VQVIITSPSLNPNRNISGMSAVVAFISSHNASCSYLTFTLGKADLDVRGIRWAANLLAQYAKWVCLTITKNGSMVHFNLAMDRRGVIRDAPLIILTRLFRRRMVVHIHGGEYLTAYEMPRWLRFLVRVALSKGPVIVLSELERVTLRRNVPKARIAVLPNCIDLDEARRFDRSTSRDAGLTIIFMGRIATDKGLPAIYQALEASRNRGTISRFVMAGAGPDEELYVRKFRELLGRDFEFVGPVAGCEKTRLLKKCNVFLLPSLFEGMPMALLESMSFGLVPITTGIGSIPEVVRDGYNGIIVNRQSPEEIANAITRLSGDREYMEALGRNARRRIFEYCNPEEYVKQLNAIYSYDEHINIPLCN
jgi:glycosyltransferase involved in cell wall biosynthesis